MSFNWIDTRVGLPPVTTIDDAQKCNLGTRARAYDPTQGPCEFVYLKGVAALVAGDAVVFDEAFVTTRTLAASRGPIAIAMAAVLAGQFGWFQVRGIAIVNVLAADAADVAQYLTATAGSLDDAVVAAGEITNCVSQSAIDTPVAGKAYVSIADAYATGDLDG